jgi:hypothetical protein
LSSWLQVGEPTFASVDLVLTWPRVVRTADLPTYIYTMARPGKRTGPSEGPFNVRTAGRLRCGYGAG